PLERALDCARRIAELCWSVLCGGDFLDEIRRLRRDLPHQIKQAMAAFVGGGAPAADLQHELGCLREVTDAIAGWIGPQQEKLQRLFAASLKGDDPAGAPMRYGEGRTAAFEECERRRRVVLESCDRAFLTANRVCTATDNAAKKLGSALPPAPEQPS